MNEFDLSKYSFCLSCNINRYRYLKKCFTSVGLNPPSLYPGVAHPTSGAEGCRIGHLGIVMMARCLNLPYIVVFEDDAYPRRDAILKFNQVISELESIDSDWGMLSLGRNGEISGWDGPVEQFWIKYPNDKTRNMLPSKVIPVSSNLISIPKNPNGSHAYVLKKCCYNEWISSLIYNRYSDIAMGACNFKQHKVYWTKELLFTNKQIDTNCMTMLGNNGTGSFMYPYNYNKDFTGVVHVTKVPPNGFETELVVEK